MRGPVAVVLVAVALTMIVGCGQIPSGSRDPVDEPSPSLSPSTEPAAGPTPRRIVSPTPTVRASASASPPRTCPAGVPQPLSLKGAQGRAFAFAPLADPDRVTVEGDVQPAQAWSTSKVLVAAAFLDTTADGDPDAVSAANRRLIAAALSRSDGDAVRSLRQQIPGGAGRAMTAVLRSIGDDRTTAPDSYEGTMSWSPREQVRFMAALAAGDVVSAETSAHLLAVMRPIEQHRWGLGSVGASVFKGGWLRQGRVTRQMGLLDGYAVAIITDRGPVVRQTDGDSAHVRGMDELAELLERRLAYETSCG